MRIFKMPSKDTTKKFHFFNATSEVALEKRHSWWVDGQNQSMCQIVDNSNGTIERGHQPCETKMWSYCEDLNVRPDDFVSPQFVTDFSINGKVLSKIFLLQFGKTCSESADFCKSRGLRLFQMSSPEAAEALFKGAASIFSENSGASLWVDGLISPACQAVANTNGRFHQVSRPCNNSMWSFCEDVKEERGQKLNFKQILLQL
jgi:hypothetical protein